MALKGQLISSGLLMLNPQGLNQFNKMPYNGLL